MSKYSERAGIEKDRFIFKVHFSLKKLPFTWQS